ncbi:Sulfurtransferase TusD [Candidatus Arsenophonus lipoptenae]|uniref:Sulfurtransferase TusD n=1 Tax=Candidatus Arsenophonus lipoptenae TaxID=634113 RepID=A0A120HPV0_9GAMM|nr:sulfurtransferase complex subunit TusD [Candidatus Arsenophonus lipoptenae]AMA64876.1 Sulfurtransferase TusD [Candidatus Arsenophonus lipoptenae]
MNKLSNLHKSKNTYNDSKKSLTYCLLVTGPAYGTQQAINAWKFANTLVMEGHILKTIFFYQEGVYNGNKFISPASDEFNLLIGWKTLAQKIGCKLNICVTGALRRGIINDIEVKNKNLTFANLDKDFVLSGLVSLTNEMLICDRTIQF